MDPREGLIQRQFHFCYMTKFETPILDTTTQTLQTYMQYDSTLKSLRKSNIQPLKYLNTLLITILRIHYEEHIKTAIALKISYMTSPTICLIMSNTAIM